MLLTNPVYKPGIPIGPGRSGTSEQPAKNTAKITINTYLNRIIPSNYFILKRSITKNKKAVG